MREKVGNGKGSGRGTASEIQSRGWVWVCERERVGNARVEREIERVWDGRERE